MKEELLRLADLCEAAQGPDRELDALIWCELHGVKYRGHNEAYGSYGKPNPETQVEFTEPPKRTRCVSGNPRFPHAQPVTASLDAAITLVPEAGPFILTNADLDTLGDYTSWRVSFEESGSLPVPCATPALALCAAALRARASIKEQNNGG